MKWYFLIIVFLLSGCEHRCPRVIYKDKIVVRTVEKPTFVIVSDDIKLRTAYQIAREALVAMSSSTTDYHAIKCKDGVSRYWPQYAHWKLKQIDQTLNTNP